ncbi:MAG: right-handed parallel beta-helix repeat-containing protein [bacterium]|nr:right-handed parallel beta-helix repeat-containing protein [bacterium]
MKKTMLISVVLVMASLCFGTTRRVPSQYSTIGAAMTAAVNGDSILVAPGTYNENVAFSKDGIKLVSESGATVTEIHGTGYVTINAATGCGTDSNSLIQGFKVTGGTGGMDKEGGGLRFWNSHMRVKNNIFTNNTANEGAGVYLERSNAIIESCLIYNNAAMAKKGKDGEKWSDGNGGGVYSFASDSDYDPIIRGNTIITNSANGSGNMSNGGGGIAIIRTGAIIENNYIVGNTAAFGTGGIAIFGQNETHTLTIRNNTIKNNDKIGIEVKMMNASEITVNNNQISGHTQYGMKYTYFTTGTIDATNNWWGAASGPYHATLNPSGTGNAISDTLKSSVRSINFNPWLVDTMQAVETVKPTEPYTLSTCWPNPFVHQTSVKLESKFWTIVSAYVFDITGREVRCIMNNSPKSAGSYNIGWDGKDRYGKQVSPGMYFYKVKVNNTSKTMKVIMIK